MEIKFIENQHLKTKPDQSQLGFGKLFSDYMFISEWNETNGWHDARIEPYGPIQLDPASMVLHYAQETFEGMKAYLSPENEILLFRPEMNAQRMARSNARLCMPAFPEADFVEAVKAIVSLEKAWIPQAEGTSLYIRPFMFATQASVGVHPSAEYTFMIVCSPVGSLYPSGVSPVKIYVEDEYVRAVAGGTGFAKCGGNYAGSVAAQAKAEKLGYSQVLWLDGVHRKYIEEVGTMNVMFKINNEIYTAPIDGTVLPGVTRDSIIKMLKDWGYKVNEVHLAIDELLEFAHKGQLEEAFGTGTAAVISPIGELNYQGDIVTINDFKTGDITQKIYDTLTGIQWGKVEDPYHWVVKI